MWGESVTEPAGGAAEDRLRFVGARVIDQLDGWIGARVESAVRAHHRRRLSRAEQIRQLDPPDAPELLWAAGEPPPREGNELDVLIDGAQALPLLAQALRDARWTSTSRVARDGGVRPDARGPAQRLRDLLGELAEQVSVRVLLWAGAPVPLFTPTRKAVRGMREELVRGTRVQCALDPRERPMHCHHEKIVIIDGETAFVGGIDLTSVGGDRFDTRSIQPARADRLARCRDAAARPGRCGRRRALHRALERGHGRELPAPERPLPAGGHTVQIVRTVPEKVYDFLPHGDFRILEAYIARAALRRRLDLSREPVPVVAGARRHPRRETAPPAARATSASSSCCPPTPTTGPTRRAGSSAFSPAADDGGRQVPRGDALLAQRRR